MATNIEALSIPEMSEEDKKVIKNRQAGLLRTNQELVDQGMSNVATSGQIGSGPQMPGANMALSAIQARGDAKRQASLNDMLQRQKYAAYAKRGQNLGELQNEALKDAQRLSTKQNKIGDIMRADYGNQLDSYAIDLQASLEDSYDALAQHQMKANAEIYLINKRRKEQEERNKIISSIIGGVGTVAGAIVGGVIGGPPGAIAGGTIGSQAGKVYDATEAPRRGE